MMREAGAVMLLGGWTLLFNPKPDQLYVPRADWEEVREYDTAWLCEEGRRDEAAELAKDGTKDRPRGIASTLTGLFRRAAKERPRDSAGTLATLLRYRCEHKSQANGRAQSRR